MGGGQAGETVQDVWDIITQHRSYEFRTKAFEDNHNNMIKNHVVKIERDYNSRPWRDIAIFLRPIKGMREYQARQEITNYLRDLLNLGDTSFEYYYISKVTQDKKYLSCGCPKGTEILLFSYD